MNAGAERAVVVGGGLAGTTAALALADRGWDVTLLESRSRLGGAAYSFDRDGLTADTGQHVLLRCYDRYRALLDRLGMASHARLQDRMDIPVLDATGRVRRLRRAGRGPAPLHLLPALLGYSALTVPERMRVARAMAALRRVDHTAPRVDAETFGGWLRRHGQGRAETEALWGLLTVAALNLEVEEASLALAAHVFRTALLEDPAAADIAILDVPLSAVHDRATRDALDRAGVHWHVRERVAAVDRGAAGFTVRTAAGEVPADAVVVAVPHRPAARLVPEEACPDRATWEGLGSAPIVNVHVHYDRAVTDLPFGAVLGSPVPWFFDRTAAAGCAGQYLTVSISGADAAVEQPAERLLEQHLSALSRLFPAARTARVLDAFVTREPRATFRQRAGTAVLRPPARTALPGLVLAGAWTATGWPDTLEGAVRSGHLAADCLGSPDRRTERSVMAR
jgi:squalene-associated FAD-dependent desaturase